MLHHPHNSNAWTVIISIMVLTPTCTLFVGARVYSCLAILRRRLYLEEWLCVISLVRRLGPTSVPTLLSWTTAEN